MQTTPLLASNRHQDRLAFRFGHDSVPRTSTLPNNGFILFGSEAEQTLGSQYRLLRPIGRGATATVYLADQPAIGRKVAIKVLRRGPLGRKSLFQDEALTLGRLQHPNILTIHDYIEADGNAFIVTDYAPAGSLADVLTGQPLPSVDTALDMIRQVASALDTVHAEGMVHRDVKPANILVQVAGALHATKDTPLGHGRPWVVLGDFGLSLQNGRTGNPADADTLGTSGIVGTPAYLSPEQAKQQPLDARTDIYSLGVVAYELLTGRLPFRGEGMLDLAIQHATSEVPPMIRNGEPIAAGIQAAVRRALAKDADQRFTSAGAFAQALIAAQRTVQLGERRFALPTFGLQSLRQNRLAA